MHCRTMRGLILAALLAISGGSAGADEQVIIVARFYPAPGREAELETRLLKTVKFVRQAEPNITYRLHRSAEEPTVFLFYEIHPTQAARDQHRKLVATFTQQELGPRPDGIFRQPPEIEIYRQLAE